MHNEICKENYSTLDDAIYYHQLFSDSKHSCIGIIETETCTAYFLNGTSENELKLEIEKQNFLIKNTKSFEYPEE